MGYVLSRFVLVTLGYVLAVAVASTVVVLPQWLPLIRDTGLSDADIVFMVSQWFVVFFMLGTLAFPVAAVAIVVCEALVVRTWVAYTGLAAGIAFLLASGIQRMREMQLDIPAELAWLDFRELLHITPVETLAAGLSAGLAYWLIAGRPGRSAKRQNHVLPPVADNNPHSSQPSR